MSKEQPSLFREHQTPTKPNLLYLQKNLLEMRNGANILEKEASNLHQKLLVLAPDLINFEKDEKIIFSQAYAAFKKAQILTDESKIEQIGMSARPPEVEVKHNKVMGVDVPEAELHGKRSGLIYSKGNTSAVIDQAVVSAQKILDFLPELVKEQGLIRIYTQYKKISKRINAINNLIIPELEELIMTIKNSLEQEAQEELIRQKRFKKLKEEKEKAERNKKEK